MSRLEDLPPYQLLRVITGILEKESSGSDDLFRHLEDFNRYAISRGLHPAFRVIYQAGQPTVSVYQRYTQKDKKVLLDFIEMLGERF